MKSKTVFIEYSSSDPGQHFMTVIFVEDGKRKIIGRIFKEHNHQNKKYEYRAQDWSGHPIFTDIKSLSELKKKFIESGKQLSMTIPKSSTRLLHTPRRTFTDRKIRAGQLRSVRQKPEIKKNPNQEKEPEPEFKEWDDQMTDESGDGRPFPDQAQEREEPSPAVEASDREMELDEIRDDSNQQDRSDDMELER